MKEKNKSQIKHNTSSIARCAQLAMLLEVSAHPKPGNVDRDHDYIDTYFEHFLSSAVSIYPIIEKAAANNKKMGKFIRKAVIQSNKWQKGGNTHFGAFLLLLPLAMAAGKISRKKGNFSPDCLTLEAQKIVKKSTVKDAIQLYKSFELAKVKVRQVDEFDLSNLDSVNDIKKSKKTLFDLMKISSRYDIIAREWTSEFIQCNICAKILLEQMNADINKLNIGGSKINNAIVYAYLKLLSSNRDTFIETKYNAQIADEVSIYAEQIINKIDQQNSVDKEIVEKIQKFDDYLLKKSINPGSTADIIIGGIFIVLLGGMKI